MRTLAAFAVVFAVLSSLAPAQEKDGIPEHVAKELSCFVGEWFVEGDLAGKALKGQWSAQWAPQKHCVFFTSDLLLGDERIHSNGVSSWDAGKEEIVTLQSFSNGVTEDIRYKLGSPGVLKGKHTLSAGAKVQKADCEIRVTDHLEWTFTTTVNAFGGEKGSEFTIRFYRSKNPTDEQAVSPFYKHLKDLEDFIGDWVAEETLNVDVPRLAKKGQSVTRRAFVRWKYGKSLMQVYFISTADDGKSVNGRWLFTWDAWSNRITFSGADSAGGRDWGTLKKESPDKWVWKWNWCDPDKAKGSVNDVTTMVDGHSTHVHEYTDVVLDGKPQPDGKLVYKRVK